MKTGLMKAYEDNLIVVWMNDDESRSLGGPRWVRQGKRVPKSCSLTYEERRAYVEQGTVATVKLIKKNNPMGLKEAMDLLNAARGERKYYDWTYGG